MAVEYRPMRWEEEGSAVQLWMSALETDEYEALQTFRDFSTNPQRFDQSYVAVADDGALLATVCYWLRDVRDITGQPVRIGHLYHVATHPAARRQGHAGKLLTHTIRALHCARCTWAILSARQDAVPLYRRYGWQAVPRGYIRGVYDATRWTSAQRYPICTYDPRQDADGWQRLATAYAAANTRRAGSLIRTNAYWSHYAAWMFGLYLDSYEAVLLTAIDTTPPAALRGYALVNFYDMGFVVSEIAADSADPYVLSSLLTSIIAEAGNRRIPLQGQLTIPVEAQTLAVLQQFFGTTLHIVDDTAVHGYAPFMVRSVQGETPDRTLDNPFTAPGALFWPLDAY